MTEDQAGPAGPDLAGGISFADLPDGGKLLGHVGDEPVLLVRRGADVFAVGAHCTALPWPARRRARGRRHGALPLASRLL